jgi:hypothetical protein
VHWKRLGGSAEEVLSAGAAMAFLLVSVVSAPRLLAKTGSLTAPVVAARIA